MHRPARTCSSDKDASSARAVATACVRPSSSRFTSSACSRSVASWRHRRCQKHGRHSAGARDGKHLIHALMQLLAKRLHLLLLLGQFVLAHTPSRCAAPPATLRPLYLQLGRQLLSPLLHTALSLDALILSAAISMRAIAAAGSARFRTLPSAPRSDRMPDSSPAQHGTRRCRMTHNSTCMHTYKHCAMPPPNQRAHLQIERAAAARPGTRPPSCCPQSPPPSPQTHPQRFFAACIAISVACCADHAGSRTHLAQRRPRPRLQCVRGMSACAQMRDPPPPATHPELDSCACFSNAACSAAVLSRSGSGAKPLAEIGALAACTQHHQHQRPRAHTSTPTLLAVASICVSSSNTRSALSSMAAVQLGDAQQRVCSNVRLVRKALIG